MPKPKPIKNNMTIRDKANCCIAYLTLPAIIEMNRQSMIIWISKMYSLEESEVIYNEIRSLAPDQFSPEQVRIF